jgi:hypothetical protein
MESADFHKAYANKERGQAHKNRHAGSMNTSVATDQTFA